MTSGQSDSATTTACTDRTTGSEEGTIANFDLPVRATLPGDPEALRSAAAATRRIAETTGEDASRQVGAARRSADAGWHGPAATAFGNAVDEARGRVDELVAAAHRIAPPLLAYADTLERLQAEFVRVQAEWRALNGAMLRVLGGEPETPGLQAAFDAAEAGLTRILAEAAQANAAASDQLTAVIDALTARERGAEKTALSIVSAGLGEKFTFLERFFEDPHVGQQAAATGARIAGRALTPVTSFFSQVIDDTTNPNYSVAERVGRGFGKAVFNGVPALFAGIGGGLLGGGIGAAVGGPAAPLTGGAGAVVGGAAAAWIVDRTMSEIPIQDDVIDASGEVFDSFGEQFRPTG